MAIDPARAKSLFLNVSDLDDPAERAAYLDRECGEDGELRHRVEALLRANEDLPPPAPPFGMYVERSGVQDPAQKVNTTSISMTAVYDRNAGAELLIAGRYTLQEKIGEGGIGEVWVAKQSEPVKRKVALKLIKPGMDSRAVLQRFEQERQALALMDHTNIAKVFDAGMTPNGQPFFVMELVNGQPLNRFCDELKLTPNERLELFVPICQAVQHAHQKGIVHRDLKPANILVTMIDGKPVPKVIDFGLAKATAGKLTDASMSTQFGAVLGTLEYMAPEQAGFSGEDIDTRADIYSLGIILYELLIGVRPIQAARLKKVALAEIIRIVRDEEPSKPSTRLSTDASFASLAALRQIEPGKLLALLRGDLDWVVMKCLEKSRERRYETANTLARDVQRHLNGEAVEACPPSVGYRMGKFLKRNKGPVFASSLVLLALLGGLIGTAWGLVRANRARAEEATQREIAVAEKRRTEVREELAIDAVKKFRDAVADNPELKSNPSLASLRMTLLKEPLAFFRALRDRLLADNDTRPESMTRLADAGAELGFLTDEIGDKQDALIAYRESLAIRERLVDANPSVIKFQSDLAASYSNVGLLLGDTGKPVEALKSYESALAIRQKLANAEPDITHFQSDLAVSYNNIGVLQRATGRPVEALKAYESALAIRKKLADIDPALYQSDLAVSYNNIGNLLSDTGKRAEALKAYESALAIRQKLADANPGSTQSQLGLANSHNSIAVLLGSTGKPVEALKLYESARAIQQTLADANPTVTSFQSDLAVSYNNIGNLLVDTGKPVEALKAYESALAIRQKLTDANPAVSKFRSYLAASYNSIGGVLTDTGKPVEALKRFESALAIRQELADANPALTEFQSKLANSYNNIGSVLDATGKPDDALQAYETALAILQKLADKNPSVTTLQGDLANTYNSIGSQLSSRGKPVEAVMAYESALVIWRKLVREFPNAADYASGLGGTLNNIATIDIGARRFAEARDRLQQAISWQSKALAFVPTHPTYRSYLSNHLINLIDAARGLGDTEGAARAELELARHNESAPAIKALDARLAAVIKGDERPKDNTERVQLAEQAQRKLLLATSAQLWAEAFASAPELTSDRKAQHGYNAACAAALAGCGQGKDDPQPDEAARSKLRQQALDWLKAELSAWTRASMNIEPRSKELVAKTLAHWKQDSDLAGIREAEDLAKLSNEEQSSFKQLWADVDVLLAKVKGDGK